MTERPFEAWEDPSVWGGVGQSRKIVWLRPSKKICQKCMLSGTSGVVWGDLWTFWSDFRMQNVKNDFSD